MPAGLHGWMKAFFLFLSQNFLKETVTENPNWILSFCPSRSSKRPQDKMDPQTLMEIIDDDAQVFEVEKILDSRVVNGVHYYLIKWKNYDDRWSVIWMQLVSSCIAEMKSFREIANQWWLDSLLTTMPQWKYLGAWKKPKLSSNTCGIQRKTKAEQKRAITWRLSEAFGAGEYSEGYVQRGIM